MEFCIFAEKNIILVNTSKFYYIKVNSSVIHISGHGIFQYTAIHVTCCTCVPKNHLLLVLRLGIQSWVIVYICLFLQSNVFGTARVDKIT